MYIVVVPFIIVVIAYGLAALAAVGVAMALLIIIKYLFMLTCFGGGAFLLFVGIYQLIRLIRLRLYGRLWLSGYAAWIAIALFAFSYGFRVMYEERFTRSVPSEHVWSTPKWFFWTEIHSETRYESRKTYWYTAAQILRYSSQWLLVLAACGIATETYIRFRPEIHAGVTSKLKAMKKLLDGPTAR